MNLNRREFLRLATLVAAGATASACAPVVKQANQFGSAASAGQWVVPPINSLYPILRRITYAPTLADRILAEENGIAAWIEEQLDPDAKDSFRTTLPWRNFDLVELQANELVTRKKTIVLDQFKRATLLRRIYSGRQLYEMMVEFWTDHFNISINKGDCWFLKVVDDREVIRRHALGNFREMLHASAKSPAMLVYLDNQANIKDAPNENYARELMELHTLGVDGGYSQGDVMELARCLTGWGMKKHFWYGDFQFDDTIHDMGRKVVLGKTIEPNGVGEAESVIDRLALHPNTARHIALKLIRRFVTDDPEQDAPQLVNAAADTFLATKGDISSALRVVLLDGLTTWEGELPAKIKRPSDFIVSALRLTDATTDARPVVYNFLRRMGQPLFEWPTPDGPSDVAGSWANNLLPRWQFALRLAGGNLTGAETLIPSFLEQSESLSPPQILQQLSEIFIGRPFSADAERDILSTFLAENLPVEGQIKLMIAGILASPPFQWR